MIDDEEPSRTGTPQPPQLNEKDGDSKDDTGNGEKADTASGNTGKDPEKNGDDEGRKSEEDKPVPPPKTTTADLSPDVRAKLRKLEKLEKTYPG